MNKSNIDIRDAFFDEVFTLATMDKDLIFLCADMGAYSLQTFKKELPQQYINVGVAEQNLISVAAGMALTGKNVFVYSIIPFMTLRCFEQIKIDLCCMNLPVTIVGMGPGLTYSGDGPTHHAIHDLGAMRSLPEMTIFHPSDSTAAKNCARMVYTSKTPAYVRLEKGSFPSTYCEDKADFREGFGLLKQGGDAVIISVGIMIPIAMDVADKLKRRQTDVSVVDLYRIKPLNSKGLLAVLKSAKRVITLEEHAINGGIGTAVAELMMDNNIHVPLNRLGIVDVHVFASGKREELQEHFSLSAERICERITNLLKG